MTSLFDVDDVRLVNHRTYIVVLLRRLGSREQAVQPGNEVGVRLYLRNVCLHRLHQFRKQPLFQAQYLVLGTQDLLLVLLQLGCDIALGLCQRLLTNPVLWHLILKGVTHLQIVAKHVIEAYLQRRDARLLYFALLNLQQVVLAAVGNVAQFVQLAVHTLADDATLVDQLWRVVLYFTFYTVTQRFTGIQLLPHPSECLILGILTSSLDGLQGCQRPLQLYYLTRRNASYSHLRDDAFQVANLVQRLVNTLAELRLTEEVIHNVQTLVNHSLVLQGEYHPASQQSTAHRRYRTVNDIQ